MRRILRMTMAVLFGLVAAIVTNRSLDRPMWRHESDIPGSIRPLGFAPQDQALLTLHGFDASDGTRDRPRIVWWDTETGAQLKSIELDVPDKHGFLRIELGADDDSIVIAEEDHAGWIYDLQTGKPRFGPLEQIAGSGGGSFSSDGRWYSSVRGPRKAVAILDARTGEDALVIEPPADQVAHETSLHPRSNQIAVLWVPKTEELNLIATKMTLEFFEIPTGRSTIRKSLKGSWSFRGWYDDRIRLATYFDAKAVSGGIEMKERIVSWHIAGLDLDDERDEFLFDRFDTEDGSLDYSFDHDLVVRKASGKAKSRFQSLYGRLMTSAFPAAQFVPPGFGRVHLTLIDARSGRTCAELPDLSSFNAVSPDGRQVGCTSFGGFVEMWDTAPSPRWPWAGAAGLVVAGATWFLTRKRWRRAQAPQEPQLVSGT